MAGLVNSPRGGLLAVSLQNLVFDRDEELAVTRIALAGAAAGELAVDSPRLVPLGPDDVEAALVGDPLAEFDVGAAAGHVGRHRDPPGLTRLRDDLGFDLVVLRVQDLVFDPGGREQGGEPLRLLDRPSADQDGDALVVPIHDLVGDRLELLRLGREHAVGDPDAPAASVGRHLEDSDLVDLAEFAGVSRRRAGHPRKLLVPEEEVLDGHAGCGDRFQGDFEPFLGLDRLVKAVLPLASRHHAARELVDDHDLAVDDHVVAVFEVRDLGAKGALDVLVEPVHGQGPERRVAGGDLHLAAPGGVQLGLAFGGVVFEILGPDQGRGELVGAVVGRGLFLGGLVVGPDNQWRPCLVDQDAVGLVDDGVVVGPLDGQLAFLVLSAAEEGLLEALAVSVTELEPLQLVAEEVETELLAGPVRDVATVGRPAGAVGHPGLDAADAHPQQVIDRRIPVGVALREVVVDRDDVDAFALQRVEEGRKGGDQGLPFAGLHLGDRAVMDRRAADELDVVMALLDGPLGRLADEGEGFDEQAVE